MHLVNLLLSAAFFVSGSYLCFRGWERKEALAKSVAHSGHALGEKPFESHLTKEDCIYSHLIVEYHQPRRTPGALEWVPAIDMKRHSLFSVGGVRFDPIGADIYSKPVQVAGYIRYAGMLHEFMNRSMAASLNQPIDPRIASNLLSSPEVKSRLAPHMTKTLRVTETVVPEGAEVFVLSKGQHSIHEAERPYLISVSGEAKARSSIAKTAYAGMAVGTALIAAALAIILFF